MGFETRENEVVYLDESGRRLAEVTFPATGEDGVVDINHTFVDPSLRGQGVAGGLLRAAADELRASGRKAHLSCSYAVKWFEKHPEEDDLLA